MAPQTRTLQQVRQEEQPHTGEARVSKGSQHTRTHVDLQTGFGPRPQRREVAERATAPELLEQGHSQSVQEGDTLALPGARPPLLYTTQSGRVAERERVGAARWGRRVRVSRGGDDVKQAAHHACLGWLAK